MKLIVNKCRNEVSSRKKGKKDSIVIRQGNEKCLKMRRRKKGKNEHSHDDIKSIRLAVLIWRDFLPLKMMRIIFQIFYINIWKRLKNIKKIKFSLVYNKRRIYLVIITHLCLMCIWFEEDRWGGNVECLAVMKNLGAFCFNQGASIYYVTILIFSKIG